MPCYAVSVSLLILCGQSCPGAQRFWARMRDLSLWDFLKEVPKEDFSSLAMNTVLCIEQVNDIDPVHCKP